MIHDTKVVYSTDVVGGYLLAVVVYWEFTLDSAWI